MTFQETPEYKSYAAFKDLYIPNIPNVSPEIVSAFNRLSELAEVAMEAAYNLGLTKIETPSNKVFGKFKCPECGSYRFGTSNCTSPIEEWIGHCNGWGCKFEWPRSDDAKYGLEE